MKKVLYAFILFSGLVACRQEPETEYTDISALRASAIYIPDSVYMYTKENGSNNLELANSYLEKSQAAEKDNFPMAIYYCKRAITLNPVMENYKKLALLLEKAGNYEELCRVYNLMVSESAVSDLGVYKSIYLFDRPDEDLVAESMIAELRAYGNISSNSIYNAQNLDISLSDLKKKIFSDERVKIDMSTLAAKDMLLMFMSPAELEAFNKLPGTFRDFLASIKDASPVFEIDKNSVRRFQYDDFTGRNEEYDGDGPVKTTSYVYRSFLKEFRENPNSWVAFNYNHLLTINDSVTGVVYAIDSSVTACPIEMRQIYHRLVIYDPKADIITSRIVAIQSGELLKTVRFDFNKFTITEYKRSWKKPYEATDFDNFITGTEKVKETSYEITATGSINEVPAAVVVE